MKKFLSLILALAMVACMSVTAFAAEGPGGSTELTTTVPEKTLYTLHIPADMTIEYGATKTSIGKPTVSDVDDTIESVSIACNWTNFSDGSNSIPLLILINGGQDASMVVPYFYNDSIYKNNYEYFASVAESDWTAAVPGDYSATITWTTNYHLK